MPRRSTIKYAVGGAAFLCLLLTGCSDGSTATTDTKIPSLETTVTADETCKQLSDLEQIEADARAAVATGELSQDEYAVALKDQVSGFEQVQVQPNSDLAERLADFVAYIQATGPATDGSPYVRNSIEYRDVAEPLVGACIDAGSDIVVTNSGG